MLRLTLLALALLVAGCNLIYKQNIPQGNVLDEDDMEQLEVGLTKRQVEVLLGTPAVRSPFHEDRWDYINSFARGGRDPERRTLTVVFEDDRVVDFFGSYLDASGIAGTDPEDLEIIDPDDNQPVLPRRPREIEDDEPVPTPDPPR
ncbi:outer membrane protein assembly factor BamE [Wenzhouxiangella sp. XN79A]|uniref:outer membrane protein assembly factor BamE n=1 Tax=Wenzhouxiangella sp. XN79A TaxID=2724193 RepID=UPI00144AC8CD|nr:outer membrane protein assembly factor BamE [Wenzhouxiangella sp. XN79A]NKI34812.1 outer membrane protein assembly factor BamE [Wenzhouxiangella sp. XN79A]